MDILDRMKDILEEGNGSRGDQVGRLLLNRFLNTSDPNETQNLMFLSLIILVSIGTDDNPLLTKCKRILKKGHSHIRVRQ